VKCSAEVLDVGEQQASRRVRRGARRSRQCADGLFGTPRASCPMEMLALREPEKEKVECARARTPRSRRATRRSTERCWQQPVKHELLPMTEGVDEAVHEDWRHREASLSWLCVDHQALA